MTTATKDRIWDYLFLIIVACIAYWPVSFMQFSLKNDALNYFLPVRYNISEAIQHGYFPAWSPYINMGYPLHGDVQSGTWNPVVIVMSLIRKYDIYWLHIETIIAIIIAGISMYHLLKYLKCSRKVILIVSSAYMLNGFISDSGQFINWIYAASYLPFVLMSALQSFNSFTFKHSFKLGFSLSLMFVSAYPADFILLFYLLVSFVLYSFFVIHKKMEFRLRLSAYTKQIVLASISFLIISLPALISFINFFSNVDRGNGVSIESALSNSLAPINLISFIAPWPTLSANAYQYTDPLIRNCYAGFLLLLFFIYRLVYIKKTDYLDWFLLVVISLFILFSLGETGGVRVLAFRFLPLMDTFRHPANAKLFFITAIQLLAALGLNDFLYSKQSNKKVFKKLLVISAIIAVVPAIVSAFYSNIAGTITNNLSKISGSDLLKQIKDNLSFSDMLLLNCIFLLFIISVAYLLIKKERFDKYLMLLVLFEMTIIVQGMLPLTYVKNLNPAQVQEIIDLQPKGYPIPDNQASIADFSKNGTDYFSILGSLNPYNKKPGRIDYIISPSNLSSQQRFWDNIKFRNKIIQYPLFYFADTIISSKDTLQLYTYYGVKKIAIADNSLFNFGTGDTDEKAIEIEKFVPGRVVVTATVNQPSFLVFQQNYYNKWNVFVNRKKADIKKVNTSFIAVIVPPGKNEVVFYYNLENLLITSILSLLFIAGSLFLFTYKKEDIK